MSSAPVDKGPAAAAVGAEFADRLKPGEILILGLTHEGRRFRPSDWAERLAGVMAQFRPQGAAHAQRHLCYSPFCMPTKVDGVSAVVLSRDLRAVEPMAYDFVLSFARDNNLQTVEACIIDLPGAPPTAGRRAAA